LSKKYHYIYRITNIRENKHYIGVRSSSITPYDDLGKKYFSSSTDSEFIKSQKEHPENFIYYIIEIFNTREEALKHEIYLHDKFNVAVNENFYNKAKQTSLGFDTSGIIFSKERRLKCIELNTGIKNPFYGKKHTEELKNALSVLYKEMKGVCRYCGK